MLPLHTHIKILSSKCVILNQASHFIWLYFSSACKCTQTWLLPTVKLDTTVFLRGGSQALEIDDLYIVAEEMFRVFGLIWAPLFRSVLYD